MSYLLPCSCLFGILKAGVNTNEARIENEAQISASSLLLLKMENEVYQTARNLRIQSQNGCLRFGARRNSCS